MNQRNLDHTGHRSWGSLGTVAAASAAALTLLLGTASTGASAAIASNQFPADLRPAPSVTVRVKHDPVVRDCFMGRPNWHHMTAAVPQCRVR